MPKPSFVDGSTKISHFSKYFLGSPINLSITSTRFSRLRSFIFFFTEFKKFKSLADKKREIFDEDLQTLISEIQYGEDQRYTLVDLEIKSKLGKSPNAKIMIGHEGQINVSESLGDGAVDAIFNAIEKLIDSGSKLEVYSVNAVTQGTDSQGEVSVRLEKDGKIVNGQGADTDILVASAKAYLNAINLMQNPEKVHPQLGGI